MLHCASSSASARASWGSARRMRTPSVPASACSPALPAPAVGLTPVAEHPAADGISAELVAWLMPRGLVHKAAPEGLRAKAGALLFTTTVQLSERDEQRMAVEH